VIFELPAVDWSALVRVEVVAVVAGAFVCEVLSPEPVVEAVLPPTPDSVGLSFEIELRKDETAAFMEVGKGVMFYFGS